MSCFKQLKDSTCFNWNETFLFGVAVLKRTIMKQQSSAVENVFESLQICAKELIDLGANGAKVFIHLSIYIKGIYLTSSSSSTTTIFIL
jgi:hypothetical protein